jgi:hypothetical protein
MNAIVIAKTVTNPYIKHRAERQNSFARINAEISGGTAIVKW